MTRPSLEDALPSSDMEAVRLLKALDELGYDFTPVTPITHSRVVARPAMRMASDLRGVFGWSLPFDAGLLPPPLLELMERAGVLARTRGGLRSKVRVSRIRGQLFLHSAFPTLADDSVFLGPDTVRFANFIAANLAGETRGRLVDVGAGAGVGGIIAGRIAKRLEIELVDINDKALRYAKINAAHAGVAIRAYRSDGVASVPSRFDVAVANPPFIAGRDGPLYRSGGRMNGAELSLQWTVDAVRRLKAGGRVLLYTGSAIIQGRDALREALEEALPPLRCTMDYRELDPDIFSEELERDIYSEVERIAAVGAVCTRDK